MGDLDRLYRIAAAAVRSMTMEIDGDVVAALAHVRRCDPTIWGPVPNVRSSASVLRAGASASRAGAGAVERARGAARHAEGDESCATSGGRRKRGRLCDTQEHHRQVRPHAARLLSKICSSR